MDITEKAENDARRRCPVCRRSKGRATSEQIEKSAVCDIAQCPFHEHIFSAIRAAKRAELLEFNVSQPEALEGSELDISWRTCNCKQVFITNYGEVALSGEMKILVTRSTDAIEIILEDLFGERSAAKKALKVLPRPNLEIIECTTHILSGECLFIRYSASDFSNIQLKDESGNRIADLSQHNVYTSPPLMTGSKWFIEVEGSNGGHIQQEIDIRVFEPPVIHFFSCDRVETVDTSPILLTFSFQHAAKAEILLNDVPIADVSDLSTYTHFPENKTETVLTSRYELAVTGLTGKIVRTALADGISVYPQPAITALRSTPGSILLFPEQISISNQASFCEKILFSDGISEQIISPGTTISLAPTQSTTYSFTPIGKHDFHGAPQTLFVEVCYLIELKASSSKKITLPNMPVTISWESKNHTQIFIEPGNIDVTHQTSYDLQLGHKTTVTVIAINKRDRKEVLHFIDVLQYQNINRDIIRPLPQPDLHFPRPDLHFPKLENIVPGIEKAIPAQKQAIPQRTAALPSTKKLALLQKIIPKIDFDFQRIWRNKMFEKLKSAHKKDIT